MFRGVFKAVVLGFVLVSLDSNFSLSAQTIAPAKTPADTFVFNNRSEPESIDPAIATGVPDNNLVVQLFEGLMTRDQDWITIVPGQAESYQLSKDSKTYTFKLRKNLKWSDGAPLTAKDFEYAWTRAIDPATTAQYSVWLTNFVEGAAEFNKASTEENRKKLGFKAVDDLTFVVKLKFPVPYFIQMCAESVTYPVKKETVEKSKDRWTRAENMVSNGAYLLKSWKVGDRIELEKNPNYRDAAKTKILKVIALPIEDRQVALNLYNQGQLDWTGQTSLPNQMLGALKERADFRVFPGFSSYYYWINTTRGPLKDLRVRQALTLAIDRDEIVSKITRGGELATFNFIPPFKGYTPGKGISVGSREANIKRAKALLAEAGFADGKNFPKLNLLYNSDENHKRVALAATAMWKKNLGIEVAPFNQEWKVYLKSQRSGEFDLSRGAWSGDYPDPSTFLELGNSNSELNNSRLKDPAYDEAFNAANRETNKGKRDKLNTAAETKFLSDSMIIPIYIWSNFSLMRPEIKGYSGNPIDRPFIRLMSKG